ncbi:helicase-associated domain-containing protein [Paenibacillus roseipurpureus]|uniref:Helicase-associated domain-containing protein n=1 Tax=Paenibacillus roseopurpureus TaxID=2918901 RepID=A0AA96LSP1_9BACL|nr:helicase-associated domain-containing protein [Paenibacillus sp. MBLB1832]WNR46559.1 helicase-associated domain-containing protein [Paenibacillus sp. MBLB1832]
MRYEQIERKMPHAWRQLIVTQSWCANLHQADKSLADLLTTPDKLAMLLEVLTSNERKTLQLVMSSFGCMPFTAEKLEREAALSLSGAQVSLSLLGLRRYGILVGFRKSWGDQLFILPEDAFDAWQALLFPTCLLQSGVTEIELGSHGDFDASMTYSRGLAQELFHFLESCSRQSVLPLTNKGTLHKKQLSKLTEHVSLPGTILSRSGLKYAFMDVYDEPAAFLLEIAIRMGFLYKNEQGDRFLLHEDSLRRWLHGSFVEQQGQLYDIWRGMMSPAFVWLQHAMALMERTVDERWYSVNELLQVIHEGCSSSSGYQQIEDTVLREELMASWLSPLGDFRFVELTRGVNQEIWFRWLIKLKPRQPEKELAIVSGQREQSPPSMYVQPDFEILITPDATLHTEWEIAAFADLISSDGVRMYRLTKESFQRALDLGWASTDVIRILQAHAYYDIPSGFILTLQQWEEQKDKLYIEDVTLLRCKSVEIADALLRHEKCRSYLGERIGESSFIVPQASLKHVTKCLESMGFHPNAKRQPKPNQTGDAARSPINATASCEPTSALDPIAGPCYSRDTIAIYDIDPHLPRQEDLYPNMAHIPASWIQEFRDYHPSTRKDMIRKAIEWRSLLQVRKEGRDCFIIPRMVREERSGWMLEGWEHYREISLREDEWNEMKIILPGINDGAL